MISGIGVVVRQGLFYTSCDAWGDSNKQPAELRGSWKTREAAEAAVDKYKKSRQERRALRRGQQQ